MDAFWEEAKGLDTKGENTDGIERGIGIFPPNALAARTDRSLARIPAPRYPTRSFNSCTRRMIAARSIFRYFSGNRALLVHSSTATSVCNSTSSG